MVKHFAAKSHGSSGAKHGIPATKGSVKASTDLLVHDDWAPQRVWVGHILNNERADFCVAAASLVNLCVVILQTDLQSDLRANESSTNLWMQVLSGITLLLFTIESCARLYVYRRLLLHHPFFMLDLIVSLVDIIFLCISGNHDFVPMLSCLRFWRILRLIDSLSRMDQFRELYLMVGGLHAALKALIWAVVIIGCTLLFCSIFAVQIIHPLNKEIAETGFYGDCTRCPKAFASVWDSCLTFIQQIITGDSWGLVTLPIIDAYPYSALFFLPVYLIIDMAMMNLVLMVVVDQAESARDNDTQRLLLDKEKAIEAAKQVLCEVCVEMDSDKSGHLTLAELIDGAQTNLQFSETLRLMDIRKGDLETVFNILDQDESGTVEYAEFCDQLHRMKTDDSHTMLVLMRHQLKQLSHDMRRQLEYHEEELRMHKEEMALLQTDVLQKFGAHESLLQRIYSLLQRKENVKLEPEAIKQEPKAFKQELAAMKQEVTSSKEEPRVGLGIPEDKASSELPSDFFNLASIADVGHEPLDSKLLDVNYMALELSHLKAWISQELTPILEEKLLPVMQDVRLRLDASEDQANVQLKGTSSSLLSTPWRCNTCRSPPTIRVNALLPDDVAAMPSIGKARNSRNQSR